MSKTYIADLSAMAILYNYQCDRTGVIRSEKIIEFTNAINNILKEDSEYKVINLREYNDIKVYYTSQDEEGNQYTILDPDADIDKAKSWYLETLPSEIIMASKEEEPLGTIGLKLVDGRFVRSDAKIRTRVKDYSN